MVDTSGSVDSEHMLKIDFAKVGLKFCVFLKSFWRTHMSFFGATGTPVLDFW